MPLQHRHEYAAALPRGLRAGEKNRPKESHSAKQSACAAIPAILQVGAGAAA
jgi:hypothetical protein